MVDMRQQTSCVVSCRGSAKSSFVKGTVTVLVLLYCSLFQTAHRLVGQDDMTAVNLGTTDVKRSMELLVPAAGIEIKSRSRMDESLTHVASDGSGRGMEKQNISVRTPFAAKSYNTTNPHTAKVVDSLRSSLGRRFYRPFHDANTTKSSNNLWSSSSSMPQWMKDYMDWHHHQRRQFLNSTHWKNLRYLVIQCLDKFVKCGGTSDRLKPLPTMLRAAARSQRLLLIYWNHPCSLEEFLLPPQGGLDWRIPNWLAEELNHEGVLMEGSSFKNPRVNGSRTLRVQYQSYDGGAGWYDEQRKDISDSVKEASFNEVYHDVWRAVFTPAPAIAKTIQTVLDDNGLVPGDYSSAHLRLLYFKSERKPKIIEKFTRNGINCASTLKPGRPVFLASDSAYVTEYGPQWGAQLNATVVVHHHHPNPPLHLDRPDGTLPSQALVAANGTTQMTRNAIRHPPSDFYDTFIDLYLLALGGCSFFGKGGYGLWGALIGGNLACAYKEKMKGGSIANPCTFPYGNASVSSLEKERVEVMPEPLFLEPMDYQVAQKKT